MDTIIRLCLVLGALGIAGGCATGQQVANSEGKGMRRTYHVSYDTAWLASRGAVAYNDLRILDIDRKNGSILAKRDVNVTSFGEDVGVWVRPLGPELTQIEVYGQRIWGPFLPRNLEKPILDDISTILNE